MSFPSNASSNGEALLAPEAHIDVLTPKPIPPPPNGEFWWASSEWWWTDPIKALDLEDGLHFFGSALYKEDPLWKFSVGVVSHFELDPSRRPTAPSKRYASVPIATVWGELAGFTGWYMVIYAMDDKWCLCWLNVSQSVRQVLASGDVVELARSQEHRQLLDIKNEYFHEKSAFLPGTRSLPEAQFSLADPSSSMWVDVEVRFDVQLEGWAAIDFSPGPTPMNSVLLNIPQWKFQPL